MGFGPEKDPIRAVENTAGDRLVCFHRMAKSVRQLGKTGFRVLTSVGLMAIIRVRPHEFGSRDRIESGNWSSSAAQVPYPI